MQFGVFRVGDVTTDPTNGRTPSEAERIKAMIILSTATTLITTIDPVKIAEDDAMRQHLDPSAPPRRAAVRLARIDPQPWPAVPHGSSP